MLFAIKSENFYPEFSFRLIKPFLKKRPAYVISFPKCGRTWLMVLMGRYLCQKYGIDQKWVTEPSYLTRMTGLRPTLFTHDRSAIFGAPEFHSPMDKSMYSRSKVVFLIRDPKDVVVSYYFHVSRKHKRYDKSIHEFIHGDLQPMQKLINFYKVWDKSRDVPEDFMLISYEEMHADTENVLRNVLTFLEEEQVDEDILRASVEFSRFENLKRLEKADYFHRKRLRPGDVSDTESYSTRRGKIHGYTDYLSEEDIQYLDGIIEELKSPFYLTS